MSIIVSKSNKKTSIVQSSFVDTADRPLARAFETATNALPARKSDRLIDVSERLVKYNFSFPCGRAFA